MTIILALIIIAILILVHEWGHFIAARRIGIPVYEFSLGFGTQLLSKKKNGVMYSLRLIPLGGYVRMAGEEPGDSDDPNGFNHRTPLEKMLVSFAGPCMNFVLAILIFIYTFAVIGVGKPVDDAVLGEIIKDKPAYEAGLKSGDKILTVDQQQVSNWSDFVGIIQNEPAGQPLHLTIERAGETHDLTVVPEVNESTGKSILGVYSQVQYERQGIWASIKLGFVQTYQMTVLLLQGLGMMFTGAASASDLAGPVGITSMVGEAARGGMVYLLSFTAFLSINLGILNMLPIPALDGSRFVFAIVEAIRRKPLDPEKEGFIHWLGFLFLMGLIVLATYNDIVRLIKG
ncbi:MAG TPA: RIP metalloprotease RseP [Syntrophomonas sp.]|nr:RIP metalloprotease RseP [Syntrophomonas sp.]